MDILKKKNELEVIDDINLLKPIKSKYNSQIEPNDQSMTVIS